MRIEKIKSFLKAGSERTVKAKQNILISIFLKGFSILISLLLIPLTLGYLSSYEYGVWLTLSSILMWVNYFDIGLGNGLRNKLAESIADENFELGREYVSTSFFLLSVIVFIIIVLFSIANIWLNWSDMLNITQDVIPNLNRLVLILFSLFGVSFVLKLLGNIFYAFQMPAFNDFLIFCGNLLSLIFVFLLTKTTDGSLQKVAIAFSFAPLVVYLIAYPFTFLKYKNIRPSIRYVKLNHARALLGLGLKFFVLQLACLILFSTANILISRFFNPKEVTPYNIAFKYFSIITMTFNIIITPFWSAMTDAHMKCDYIWIRQSIKTMMKIWVFCVCVVFVMILVSKFIYEIWIGDQIEISYGLSFSIAIYAIIFTWNQIFTSYLNGVGKLNIQMWCAIISAILFIPIAKILSTFWGVEGISYALSFSLLISAIVLPIDCYRLISKYENKLIQL